MFPAVMLRVAHPVIRFLVLGDFFLFKGAREKFSDCFSLFFFSLGGIRLLLKKLE